MTDRWDEDHVVGVLGGLGPLATALFLEMVVERTDVATDQENIDMVVTQHSSTPDRTAHILDPSAPDPTPALVGDAQLLARMGARVLVLPCNTAHFFVHAVEDAVDLPLLSIVSETVAKAHRRVREGAAVGVLGTVGTLRAGVYQRELEGAGHPAVLPTDAEEEVVMDVIYNQVKAGRPLELEAFSEVMDSLVERGASVVVMGCTELSVVASREHMLADPKVVDSLDSLAIATVLWSGRPLRAVS